MHYLNDQKINANTWKNKQNNYDSLFTTLLKFYVTSYG